MTEMLHVSAVLQTQLDRDFSPLWGVTGSVSPFEEMIHLPPGFTPLVIVDSLAGPAHALHFAPNGQPIGLVAYSDGWSIRASHELIEMLCDPWGRRTAPGPSVDSDQGEVDYLVEVCDPCQYASYEIDGVPVSDFVTPQYYDPFHVSGVRYSFCGLIDKPHQLLAGGYISWLTRPPSNQIFQAFAEVAEGTNPGPDPAAVEPKALTIRALAGVAPSFSRSWVDANPADANPTVKWPDIVGVGRDHGPYYLPDESVAQHGRSVKVEVDRVLDSLRGGATSSNASVDDIIALLTKLADPNEATFRRKFADDPGTQLAAHNIPKPIGLQPRSAEKPLPTPEDYQKVLGQLRKQRQHFNPYFGDPDVANWLSTLGTLGDLGTTLGLE